MINTTSLPEKYASSTTPPFPMMGAVKVSIIIPAWNEAENIEHVLKQIPQWVHEVLLVDGCSTDNTVDVARRIRPNIRVISEKPRGKGAALRAGYIAASGDIVIALDADGSTNPGEITAFVGMLLAGADYVKGSRFLQGGGTDDMPLLRVIGNTALLWTTNILFGTKYTDITYGYNATWKKNIHALALEINGWPSEIISNIRASRLGLRVVEVACFEEPRIGGEAKLQTWSAGWAILKAIVKEWYTNVDIKWPFKKGPKVMSQSKNTEFVPSLQTLYHEGRSLLLAQDKLPQDVYNNSLDIVEAAYNNLLATESGYYAEQSLQSYYKAHYSSGIRGLLELEEDATKPTRSVAPIAPATSTAAAAPVTATESR
jgi:glycosyltransferase involved in cell wall biosynthesis